MFDPKDFLGTILTIAQHIIFNSDTPQDEKILWWEIPSSMFDEVLPP